jgi:hypothetical protein
MLTVLISDLLLLPLLTKLPNARLRLLVLLLLLPVLLLVDLLLMQLPSARLRLQLPLRLLLPPLLLLLLRLRVMYALAAASADNGRVSAAALAYTIPTPAACALLLLPLLPSGNMIWSSSASQISPVVSFTNTARMMLPQRATATCWPVVLLYTCVVKVVLRRAATAGSKRHSGYGTAAAAAGSGCGVALLSCWQLELSLLLSSPHAVISLQPEGTGCLAASTAAPKEPSVVCAAGVAGVLTVLGCCWQTLPTGIPAHRFAASLRGCRQARAAKLGTVSQGTRQE